MALIRALLALGGLAGFALGRPMAGTVTSVGSFKMRKAPSGLFYHAEHNLLYIICGTKTNGPQYLYAYTTGGIRRCSITIPANVGVSRADGFAIAGGSAYIADSQGPLYANTAGMLGGSVYVVKWDNPCGCTSASTCAKTEVSWSPPIVSKIIIDATAASIADGGGHDATFRNSGVAIVGSYIYAINGVHPEPNLRCCYPKSLVKVALGDTAAPATAVAKWSFTSATLGRDVDMEDLTCGPDGCARYLYIGDEYNYVYRLVLGVADAASAVDMEWDLRAVVGAVDADKGIEALAYAGSTGYYYAGIQETRTVHIVKLEPPLVRLL